MKRGFAYNYLLPQGLATVATDHHKRMVEKHRAKLEEIARERLAGLRAVLQELIRTSVTIEANANDEGHLYGSVGSTEISRSLKQQDLMVTADQIILQGPLKEVGLYTVKVKLAPEVEADLVYLDPPYNQHSYLGNYHCWESLVLWDRPETYGIANKRIDVRTRKSAFNSKPGIAPALQAVIEGLKAPNLIVSFNDEGYLGRDQLVAMLSGRGEVQVIEIARPRYVGARIGIHNLKGEKVGAVGRLRNVEYLFVVSERPVRLADAA